MIKLGIWLIIIVLFATALSLGAARLFGIRKSIPVFLIGALLLPMIAFLGGTTLLICFLSYAARLPPGSDNGGDGPAFLGILGITIFGPVLLLGPGLMSGFLASFLFRRAMQRKDEEAS